MLPAFTGLSDSTISCSIRGTTLSSQIWANRRQRCQGRPFLRNGLEQTPQPGGNAVPLTKFAKGDAARVTRAKETTQSKILCTVNALYKTLKKADAIALSPSIIASLICSPGER